MGRRGRHGSGVAEVGAAVVVEIRRSALGGIPGYMEPGARLMDDRKHDVLAYMTFPGRHRTNLHSNPSARLNKEFKRRADVVVVIPNEASITG